MAERINPNPKVIHLVLKRNKNIPNSKLPLLLYREAIHLPASKKKAVVAVQKIFSKNDWSNSWSNGIYGFHHYHSITHECMAVILGKATVIVGGPKSRKIMVTKGDVLIIPAGVAHKCLKATDNFLCVGAYPQGKNYDINLGTLQEFKRATKNIKKLPVPQKDPVLGKEGLLRTYWKVK